MTSCSLTAIATTPPAALRGLGLLLALALALAGCGAATPAPGVQAADDRAPDWLDHIEDLDAWQRLAAPAREGGDLETVNFAIDVRENRALYFANSRRFPLHFDFAHAVLARPDRPILRELAGEPFRWADQGFVLGSITRNPATGVWAARFYGEGGEAHDGVLETLAQLRAHCFFGDRLGFVPVAPLPREALAAIAEQVPVLGDDDVFGERTYQALTLGTAYGYVHLARTPEDVLEASPTSILVAGFVPDELPVVAALVTSRFQTPLAHVAVLSENRGTPNMALAEAVDSGSFAAFDGELVRLDVRRDGFEVLLATPDDARRFWDAVRPRATRVPKPDVSVTALAALDELGLDDAAAYGAKAAQLGEATRTEPAPTTPGGFVVPGAFCVRHMKQGDLQGLTQRTIEAASGATNRTERKALLDALRQAIEAAPVDAALVSDVQARLRAMPAGQRAFFRSTSNAEDLPGFTAAGLYESVKVSAGPSDAEVAQAIAQVWSSLWTLRAFDERAWYGVDHTRVAMGILVQPFVEDWDAIGVAVTQNPFDGRPGVYINAQPPGGSVTAGSPGMVPEQLLVLTSTDPPAIQRLAASDPERWLLTEGQIDRLVKTLEAIDRHFAPYYDDRPADVEFMIKGEQVIVLQVRPYGSARK